MRHASVLVALALVAGCQSNTAPSAPVIEIQPGDPTTSDDLVAVITADAVDPDKNDEVSYSWAWELNGVPQPEITGEVVSADLTTRGQTWTVSVTATDREAASTTARTAVTVRNTPPVIDSLAFTPAAPNTTDDLVVVAEGHDADGEPLQYRYSWTRDGESVAVAGDTVLSALTAPNQVWEVTVVADDDFSLSVPKALSVTIANFAPVVDSVELTPSEPREQSTIQALVQASDGDGHPVTFTYRWLVNGAPVASGADDSLTGASFDKGDLVSVEVTPNDGYQSGAPVTSSAVTVLNTPPTLDGAVLTEEIFEATTATCAGVGWFDADGDAEGLQIRWQVNGASAGTSATLDGTSFDKGDKVQCFATPHDGDDAGAEVASAVVTVSNTRPSLESVDLSPTSPRTGDTVSATINGAADVDGDDLSFQYAWQVNGVGAGSGATLGSTAFVRGDTIAVEVTPNDGDNVGAAVMSDTVTVINTPPGAPVLALGPAFDLFDLHCELAAQSADPDGDDVTYAFAWTVGGAAYTGPVLNTDHPGDTVPASALTVGEVWTCAATPSDADEAGPQATSDPVTVEPSFTTATFTNCGATGRFGPAESACASAYVGTELEGAVTVTGGVQAWVVPATATYELIVAGARGGSPHDMADHFGRGAVITAEHDLTAGDTIYVLVGQAGSSAPRGVTNWYNSSGGGGTFVFYDLGDPQPLMAAGGGGGGSYTIGVHPWMNGSLTTSGHAGLDAGGTSPGGAGGANGHGGKTENYSYSAGAGAGWLSNGSGSTNTSCSYVVENGFAPRHGGLGGRGGNSQGGGENYPGGFGGGGGGTGACGSSGAGGGGGYSGGGVGDQCCTARGGGGGSFSRTAILEQAADHTNHGYVTFTLLR